MTLRHPGCHTRRISFVSRNDERADRRAGRASSRRPSGSRSSPRGSSPAIRSGDVDGLVELLADDVVMVGDGGGQGAFREPVTGVLRVARFLVGLGRLGERQGLVMEPTFVNGQPARPHTSGGSVKSVLTLDIVDGRMAAIRAVVNPEKLQHVER